MWTPPLWSPPVALSPAEQKVAARAATCKKLFVFLREVRGELFDETFQGERIERYRQTGAGKPPAPPARLAIATLWQAYTRVARSGGGGADGGFATLATGSGGPSLRNC